MLSNIRLLLGLRIVISSTMNIVKDEFGLYKTDCQFHLHLFIFMIVEATSQEKLITLK